MSYTLQDGGADDYDGNDLAAESADGDGLSLREALALANNVDPATPTPSVSTASLAGGTLMLVSGEFVVAGDVTIDGDIDGDDAIRHHGQRRSRSLRRPCSISTAAPRCSTA